MADPRFFTNHGPFLIDQIIQKTGAAVFFGGEQIHPSSENSILKRLIDDVAPLDQARGSHLSFIDNPKYRASFTQSQAGACFMRPDLLSLAPVGMVCLVTPVPYKAYALAAQMFYPTNTIPATAPMVSPQAVIDPTAHFGQGCRVDAGAIIGPGVTLGDHVWVESGAVIGEGVTIGEGSRIGIRVSLSHACVGRHVRIYPGACIGQDGFGFAIDPQGFIKVPQLGRVMIGDFCEIGANTCIDRGAGPDTVIGTGTWIDNLVQIAHNVRIGCGCILTAQVGIAGSTVIDDYVAIGGQSGIAGHLHIGKGAQLAAGSGVINNIPAGAVVMGYPALPKTQFMRHVAYLNRMIQPQGKKIVATDNKND